MNTKGKVASEDNEAFVEKIVSFPACDNSSVVVQPGDGAFDNPVPHLTAQLATVLQRRADSRYFVRSNQIDFPLCQLRSQAITVSRLVTNDTLGLSILQNQLIEKWLDQNHFVAVGRFGVDGNSVCIDTDHHLCSLATMRWANESACLLLRQTCHRQRFLRDQLLCVNPSVRTDVATP